MTLFHAPDAPAEVRSQGTPPAFAPRPGYRHRTGSVVALVIGLAIGGALLLAAAAYLLFAFGPVLVLLGGVLAFIPLTVVLLGVRWIDRWEPEPLGALIFCFIWGAGASVVIALVVDAEVQQFVAAMGGETAATQLLGLTVQAPIVEETAKGIGVLLMFWFARRHFDGPVDGVVYAATIAGGFAFTENIQYFSIGIYDASSISEILFLFFLRGIMSPFAHAVFTVMTGLLVGLAASRGSNALTVIGWFVLGLIPAILLHALWNGSAALLGGGVIWFGFYAIVQIPIFIILIVVVVQLVRREQRLTQVRLSEYAAAGWFAPDEVLALATPQGRRVAMTWARRHGVTSTMRRYIRDSTRLAFTRQRIVTGHRRAAAQADESALLADVATRRRELRGAPA
jgi:protease PrsW